MDIQRPDQTKAKRKKRLIIGAVIAVAVIATVYLVGQQLNTVFAKIKTCLTTPASCGT